MEGFTVNRAGHLTRVRPFPISIDFAEGRAENDNRESPYKRHHTHQEIERFYRASDLCLVSSLHDGMNLVAKEYVAARDDDRGVLILSRFAGASRELHDALIINPYDIELIADSIHMALEMPAAEIERRMQSLRRTVRERNIYRWAANLFSELADIRFAPQELAAKGPTEAPVELDAPSL